MTHGGRVGPHLVGGYTFYMGINREKKFKFFFSKPETTN